MAYDIDPNREFQFWEYRVSHGSALLRSPGVGAHTSNVDVLLFDVQYVALPRFLGSIKLESALPEEIATLEKRLSRPFERKQAWAVVSNGERFLFVAGKIEVRESSQDIFDSPFD